MSLNWKQQNITLSSQGTFEKREEKVNVLYIFWIVVLVLTLPQMSDLTHLKSAWVLIPSRAVTTVFWEGETRKEKLRIYSCNLTGWGGMIHPWVSNKRIGHRAAFQQLVWEPAFPVRVLKCPQNVPVGDCHPPWLAFHSILGCGHIKGRHPGTMDPSQDSVLAWAKWWNQGPGCGKQRSVCKSST